jgi:hypothetical protein
MPHTPKTMIRIFLVCSQLSDDLLVAVGAFWAGSERLWNECWIRVERPLSVVECTSVNRGVVLTTLPWTDQAANRINRNNCIRKCLRLWTTEIMLVTFACLLGDGVGKGFGLVFVT